MLPNKDFFYSALHVRSNGDIAINLFLTFLGAMVGYFSILVLENQHAFIAITGVVAVDWLFGMAKAASTKLPNGKTAFENKKAIRIVWYLLTYWIVLAVVLMIEKGFPFASWLSEAIMLPIIIFQLISALKNASKIGLIPKGVLLKILENIDSYKDSLVNNGVVEQEELNNTSNG